MAMKRCNNGHYYDPTQHVQCPYCGIPGMNADPRGGFGGVPDSGATVKLSHEPVRKPTVPEDDIKTVKKSPDEIKTVGKAQSVMGFRPLAGWLVCIDGPNKGDDFRVYYERNFIGRAPNMDISIKKDSGISRVNHAAISFDPKNKEFKIAPGDGHGMVYLNDHSVDMPMPVKHGDIIEISDTKLMFIPCCGEWFSW